MFLNISKELKEELQKEAKEKGLSLTSYIRMILLERKNKTKEEPQEKGKQKNERKESIFK